MKKVNLLLIAFTSLFFFTACTEDAVDGVIEPIPTVTIPNTAPTSVTVGETVVFNVSVVAEARIESIVVTRTDVDPDVVLDTKTSGFTNNDSDNYQFSYTPTATDAGLELTFSFVVTDRRSRTNNPVTYTLQVETATSELSEITLGSFGNANTGSFFELGEQQVRNVGYTNSNSNVIDFAYSWGTTSDANIFSLTDPIASNFFGNNTNNWSNLRDTKFKKLSSTEGGSQYASAVTENSIKEFYDNASGETTRLTELIVDDVFVLKADNGSTDTGFYIAQVTGLNTGGSGSISLKIKGVF